MSGCQLRTPFEEPHQNGISVDEIRVLALELIRSLLAVELIVAQAPDDHQHGEHLPLVSIAHFLRSTLSPHAR